MIGVGVFMGLQVDQWRETRAHREAARATLENFHTEIVKNRDGVSRVVGYHVALRDTVRGVLLTSPARPMDEVAHRFRYGGNGFSGINGVSFSHTAWDLALATQALAYIDPKLAFVIADVYNQQREFSTLQTAFEQNVFAPSSFAQQNEVAVTNALGAYLGDATWQEQALVKAYGRVLPKLDSAITQLPR